MRTVRVAAYFLAITALAILAWLNLGTQRPYHPPTPCPPTAIPTQYQPPVDCTTTGP